MVRGRSRLRARRRLLQLDLLTLSERVPGLEAVDGRPTTVVVRCDPAPPRTLDPSCGLVVTADPVLAQRLALPLTVTECQDGYVLLDEASRVRYRTHDPGWPEHAFEQEVLLEHLDEHGLEHLDEHGDVVTQPAPPRAP